MVFRLLILLWMFGLWARPLAASDTNRADGDETELDNSAQESEAKDIIPDGGILFSTQPITPITMMPEKNAHDQALEELELAKALWSKGKAEAASDVALESYDDLMSVHVSRRLKTKRRKLLSERHQAAAVYIDSSIAYIQSYVKKRGTSRSAIIEGRMRLGDLRDVARNYPELNRKLTKTLESFSALLIKAEVPMTPPSVSSATLNPPSLSSASAQAPAVSSAGATSH